jgi:3-oxoacyl-[acyl-carrier protein] reductase
MSANETLLPPDAQETPQKELTGLLAGKRAFITGGSRGIGKAICEVFAREGAIVAFNYNSNDEAAADTLERIEAQQGRAGKAFKISVTDGEGLKKMTKELVAEWGGIDILINYQQGRYLSDNHRSVMESHY